MTPSQYRGRFAPSPTGPLHFGSLIAATVSYLEARRHGGHWYVRIDDIDPERAVPGAADGILRTLEGFGFHWDGEVIRQSTRGEAYEYALSCLEDRGATYPCGCSRREILAAGHRGSLGALYPGTCRDGLPPGRQARALRVRTDHVTVDFQDQFQGRQTQPLYNSLGDFVLRRADGVIAYHLAVVVDDAWQGITHVVRGSDLLEISSAHIHLQQLLGLPVPRYAHHPVAINTDGHKLSKQTHASPIDRKHPIPWLMDAFRFLNLPIDDQTPRGRLPELWEWASTHWDPTRLSGHTRLVYEPSSSKESDATKYPNKRPDDGLAKDDDTLHHWIA